MYGKRLSAQNYSHLLNCKSINEIAAYLKNRTDYRDIFANIRYTNIHRAQLEILLTKHSFARFEALFRYELSIGQDFYEYFITRNDIDMILTCVRLLNTGNPEDFVLHMPVFFGKYTEIDQQKLTSVRSIDGLIDALDGTDYKKVLEPFARNFNAFAGKLSIEAAFNRYKFGKLKNITEKNSSGKHANEVLELFKLQNDVRTIINIYRLKRIPGTDKMLIKQFIIPEVSRLSEKQLNMLVDAPSAEDMLRQLKKTEYGSAFDPAGSGFIEDTAQRYLHKKALKGLRFSGSANAVMLCYIMLLENEISNLIHIIEGIRYSIPAGEIRQLLIGAE